MSRAYADKPFAVFNDASNRAATRAANTESTIVANEYPFATPQLTATSGGLMLTWLTDDLTRAAVNRTVATYSTWDGTAWTAPAPIADDGTADFEPQIGTLGSNDALAAWVNVKQSQRATATLGDVTADLEISVASYDGSTGSWSALTTLSNNGYLDHHPRLSTAPDGTALLVWVANTSNDLIGTASSPNDLLYATYDGVSWTAPLVAATGIPSILNLDVGYDGTGGIVLYAADEDQDMSSSTDHELYALSFNGVTWTAPSRLTNDTVTDTNPQIVHDSAGALAFAWNRDGDLVLATELDLSDLTTAVDVEGPNAGIVDHHFSIGADDSLALVWSEHSDSLIDVRYSIRDAAGLWSKALTLQADTDVERNQTGAWTPTGTLGLVYVKDRIVNQPGMVMVGGDDIAVSVPTATQSDLVFVSHALASDPAILPGSVAVTPDATAGTPTTITAEVWNAGDRALSNIDVAFYDGDPDLGGTVIDAQVVPILVGGETTSVQASWTLPTTAVPRDVVVVADPAMTQNDADQTNNRESTTVLRPDLVVDEVWTDTPAPCHSRVSFSVANIGGSPASSSVAALRIGAETGALLQSFSVGALQPDESTVLSFEWATPSTCTGATIRLFAVVDDDGAIAERNDRNNTAFVLLSEPFSGMAAGSVPDGAVVAGTSLTLAKTAGDEITANWGASCSTGDTDYALYEGQLGSFTSHRAKLCTTGGNLFDHFRSRDEQFVLSHRSPQREP